MFPTDDALLSLRVASFRDWQQESIETGLPSLWKACSKSAAFLAHGQRLENLSWRLWSHSLTEVISASPDWSDPEGDWEETSESDSESDTLAPVSASRSSSVPNEPTFHRNPSSLLRIQQKCRTSSFNSASHKARLTPGRLQSLFSNIASQPYQPPLALPSPLCAATKPHPSMDEAGNVRNECSCALTLFQVPSAATPHRDPTPDSEVLKSPIRSSVSPGEHTEGSQSGVSASTDLPKRAPMPKSQSAAHLPSPSLLRNSSGHVGKSIRPSLPRRHVSHGSQLPTASTVGNALPRNHSAKSVRIVDSLLSSTSKRSSHLARGRTSSNTSAAMSRSGSSDKPLTRVRSRDSASSKSKRTQSHERSAVPFYVNINMPSRKSDLPTTSGEPRSVVRGFSPSSSAMSSMSNAIPPVPASSPADRSPPRVALASRPAAHLPSIPGSEAEESASSSVAQSLDMPAAPPPTPFGSVLPQKGMLTTRPPRPKPANLVMTAQPSTERSPNPPPQQRRNMFFLSQSAGSDTDTESAFAQAMQNNMQKLSPQRSRNEEEPNKPTKSSSLKTQPILVPPSDTEEALDAADSSGWSSDYSSASDEEDELVASRIRMNKGKAKAEQDDAPLFTKRVPTSPHSLNRTESRGLLTQLFRPSAEEEQVVAGLLRNPSAVGLVLAARSKSSADALPARKGLQPSKSAVAMPVISYNGDKGTHFPRVEQAASNQKAPVQTSPARPIPVKSARLGGKPQDVDFSDDSESDLDELKLSPDKKAALAAAVARYQARYIAANPQTPRTVRRQMLSTELSESLRRNLLWERQSRSRLLGLGMTRSGAQPLPPPASLKEPLPNRQTAPMRQDGFAPGDISQRPLRGAASETNLISGGLHEHGW